MSNLFKSKLFLGALVAVVMLAGVVAMASTASAECSITTTLRVGSRGAEVQCLQAGLGLTADGAFGPKTYGGVKVWQASKGLVADGIFGAKSRAAWTGGTAMYPAGCNSAAGYSPTTGMPCNSGVSTGGLPAGCTSTAGFSATTGQACNGGGSPVVTGPVSVMLASNNPAASTLVAGQATANLANFTFTGSDTVTAVTLKRIGVSSDSTLSNVYLFDGATRLTDAASVSNNGMVTFSTPSGIFTVNGSKTISVKSDIATGTSGQTVGVMLESFTTASGTTNANLSGNVHTIASATLAAVSAGTVTPTAATLNPGAGVTVWQSTLTVAQRDVWLKRIALRNVGSAPASSFQNFKLFVNGVQVGTAAGLDSMGYVTFDLNSAPVMLVAGSRVVRVDADIVSGASRTVHFSLRQAADVDFVDSSFGVNIAPTATPWAPVAASTISGTSGGSLTIEKDTSSPSTNVVNAGTDVNIGTFKFTAFGEAIKVETLRVAYTGSANINADDDSLRNGRVLINGVQYGSTASLNETSDTLLAYTSFTVNYTFMPGVPTLVEVHADMFDDTGTNDIVAGTDTVVAVIAAGSSNAIRQDSLGSFSAPATAVSANTLTIAATTVTLSKNATYANQTTTVPATNYKIGSYSLAGSSVEDVLLSTLSLDVDEVVNATLNEDDLTNVYVVVKNSAGVVVAQPAPLATLSTLGQDNNFSINYTLVKNQSVTVEFFANIASGATAADSFKTDLTVTGTALTSGTAVTATSADTDGQTIAAGTASVTASKDASSAVAAIVSDNQTVSTLAARIATVTAGYNVTDVTVTVADATNVLSVELYDGATLVASRPGAASVTFSGLSWNVPANSNKVLTVKLVLGTVGVGAGTSGASIVTTLTAFTAVNTSNGVSGAGSGSAASSAMYAYASVPTVTSVALPSTTLVAGTNTLTKFSVTSNGGSAAWNRVIFSLTKTSAPTIADGTAFSVWDADTNTQIAGTALVRDTASAATCLATLLGCRVQFVPTVEQQVSGTKNYLLKATVAGTLVANDYISTNIAAPSVYAAPTTYILAVPAGSDATYALLGSTPSFVWSDMSAASHATTTSDWSNDYLVKVLPLDTQTVTKP